MKIINYKLSPCGRCSEGTKINQKKGFTLVELLVAMAVFSIIGAVIVGIFVSGIQAQKKALVAQELSSQVSYVIEYMGRAIRMAQKDSDGTCVSADHNYYTILDGTSIKFKNYEGVCQKFYSDGNGNLKEDKGIGALIITSSLTSGITVNSFKVSIAGDGIELVTQKQSRVTISLGVSKTGVSAKVQTAISQRNLDI